jgi:hypothetical protein
MHSVLKIYSVVHVSPGMVGNVGPALALSTFLLCCQDMNGIDGLCLIESKKIDQEIYPGMLSQFQYYSITSTVD